MLADEPVPAAPAALPAAPAVAPPAAPAVAPPALPAVAPPAAPADALPAPPAVAPPAAPVVSPAGQGATPVGGVQTGAGGLSHRSSRGVPIGTALGSVALVGSLAARRRHRNG